MTLSLLLVSGWTFCEDEKLIKVGNYFPIFILYLYDYEILTTILLISTPKNTANVLPKKFVVNCEL